MKIILKHSLLCITNICICTAFVTKCVVVCFNKNLSHCLLVKASSSVIQVTWYSTFAIIDILELYTSKIPYAFDVHCGCHPYSSGQKKVHVCVAYNVKDRNENVFEMETVRNV